MGARALRWRSDHFVHEIDDARSQPMLCVHCTSWDDKHRAPYRPNIGVWSQQPMRPPHTSKTHHHAAFLMPNTWLTLGHGRGCHFPIGPGNGHEAIQLLPYEGFDLVTAIPNAAIMLPQPAQTALNAKHLQHRVHHKPSALSSPSAATDM